MKNIVLQYIYVIKFLKYIKYILFVNSVEWSKSIYPGKLNRNK